MQVTETKSEGLSLEFSITVPAADVDAKITQRLTELAKTVRLPGFRPGKAPISVLRQRFADSVRGEVLEKTINEISTQVMKDKDLRPAVQPEIDIKSSDAGKDLEYLLSIEVLPKIELKDFSKIKLEKMVAEVDDSAVDQTLERMAQAYKVDEAISGKRASKAGDVVVIDFTGRIDGVEFPGGKAEGYSLELGSNSFIPGFEDQLVGVKAGDSKDVKVAFPENYGAKELAGKDAVFEVALKEIRESKPAAIDDELAKRTGVDDLESLKKSIREEHGRQYNELSHQKLRRALLDVLADEYDFDVPPKMLEGEFESIWHQFEHSRDAGQEEDDGMSDDERKEEFRAISERRVRLGLLLAEVGREHKLELSQEDINKAMMAEVQRYPGQEKAVMDYYRNNAEAMQSLTGPAFEEKVMNFILELAQLTEKKVKLDELTAEADETSARKKTAKKATSKKSAAKKAPAKKAAAKKSAAKK